MGSGFSVRAIPLLGASKRSGLRRRSQPLAPFIFSCGSSAATSLDDESVDLVVTDPPFFDNVHYSELADFFFAWQKLGPSPFVGNRVTTRHAEEVQDTSAEQFAAKIARCFR